MIASMPLEEMSYGMDVAALDPASLGDAVKAVVADVMMDPMRLSSWLGGLALAQQTAGLNTLRRLTGESPQPVAVPQPGDRRFADEAWKSNPFLQGIVEEYLVRRQAAERLVEGSRVPAATRRKATFALEMMFDALAPSNVPWLNPAVVKEAMNSGGASLIAGLQNFLDDVRHNDGRPRQVDKSGFKVGGNLAVTPARVIMRNELIELLAYEPQTPTVYEQPLLCSPPWINKYYIMDLAPGRSFVEWACKSGFQVFGISYRNPDASLAGYSMDEYLRLGLLAALDCVERVTGAPKTNIAALCLGGTLALLGLAHLAELGAEERIGWTTVTNTLVDFSEPGDLGVFTDEASVAKLERRMAERGYLEANEMSSTFDWLRGNDLVWNYVVSNWFMGRKPPAFDILAWNSDSTRLPAAMHSSYLRACYLENALVKPGAFTIAGTPIDLGKVRTPLYVLGAETDHIAPWRMTYMTTQHVGGESKFTLTSSGHIAGIVNPPGNPKSYYWTSDVAAKNRRPEEWLAEAQKVAGSWWNDWANWATARSGKRIAPFHLPPGEPAPGKYVVNQTGPLFAPSSHDGVREPSKDDTSRAGRRKRTATISEQASQAAKRRRLSARAKRS